MLEWSRLRVLDAVATTGSVTAAARALHLTSPAVSQQLRRIEAETQVQVVEPYGRGIRLTAAGQRLAARAAEMAEIARRATADLAQDTDQVSGTLRLGAIASVIRNLLPPTLSALRRDYPQLRIELIDGETVDHTRLMRERQLDAVIAESWTNVPLVWPSDTRHRVLSSQTVRMALPLEHPLADANRVGFADLAEETWACCLRGSDPYLSLIQAARAEGVELNVAYEVADYSTQLALVAAGLAVICLPEFGRIDGVALVSPQAKLERELVLLTPAGTPSPAVSAFEEMLTAYANAEEVLTGQD